MRGRLASPAVLACTLALAGCGDGGDDVLAPPAPPPAPVEPVKTRGEIEDCFRAQGIEILPFNVPALRAEHDLVVARGGSTFAWELSLARAGGIITFFVHASAAEARAGAARVRRVIERRDDPTHRGTVLVDGNVVAATFLDVPPERRRDIERCTS